MRAETTINRVIGICGAGGRWARSINLTHTPKIACILELQNGLSWVGDVELHHQKINNNQLDGSNSPREYMTWQGRIYSGIQEHVSSAIPRYCNKKGGTAVETGWALDGPTLPKGTRQHQGTPIQQSNDLLGRVAPRDDGQETFNCCICPFYINLRVIKLDIALGCFLRMVYALKK